MATIDTLQDAVNTLTSSTTSLLDEVSTSKTYLDAAKAGAEDARDTALTHKTGAETAKTGAEAARDLAYSYQQSAASAVAYQDLAAIAASKTDSAVDVFVYDTRKDSDGGAWRKRCQHTSWYNETLNTSTRGSRKEFPAVAVIVAETGAVTIYDGDDPDMPMWMVFDAYGSYGNGGILRVANDRKKVTMLNGVMGVSSARNDGGFHYVSFIDEAARFYTHLSTYRADWNFDISKRNTLSTSNWSQNTNYSIANYYSNDVAMTVLPNAPIDDATGLPIPTIAVATNGGVSVIKDDGTVTSLATPSNVAVSVSWLSNTHLAADTGGYSYVFTLASLPKTVSGYISSQTPSSDLWHHYSVSQGYNTYNYTLAGTGGTYNVETVGEYLGSYNDAGLTLIDENYENYQEGSCAYITSDYNTGWMNGDIKLATLSDTDDADVTGAELVTNGTFDTDVSGWSGYASGTIAWSSGQMVITSAGDYWGGVQAVTVETGKSYLVTWDLATSGRMRLGNSLGGMQYFNQALTAGSYSYTITANDSTLYIHASSSSASGSATYDNISVRLIEEDRSVNGNGLQVFGTVTKNPVATGADLVAYSGWSGSNYLEQPDNTDLDFGTGDFSAMGWFKSNTTTGGNQAFFVRGLTDTNSYAMIEPYISVNGTVDVLTRNASEALTYFSTSTNVMTQTWVHWCMVRSNGVMYWYVNGKLDNSGANTLDVTPSSGKKILRIGTDASNVKTFPGSLALFRISATAPTAEQIAKIYEDEKVLFQENAKATLYGSSDAVTALAYDDDTNLLHVGTSSGRSDFNGLRRVNNTTDAVTEAISASNGLIAED